MILMVMVMVPHFVNGISVSFIFAKFQGQFYSLSDNYIGRNLHLITEIIVKINMSLYK